MSNAFKSYLCEDTAQQHTVDRIIRIPEMLKLLKVSRSTLYRWTKNKHFAEPITQNGKTLGWTLSSYRKWLKNN